MKQKGFISMKFQYQKGRNDHLVICLHGTGGQADSLFPMGHYIDPEASLIGFQGEVNENGLARYFERYEDGRFNLQSLDEASKDFMESLDQFLEEHPEYTPEKRTLIAYSNGANLTLNILKYQDLKIRNAILFHPSLFRENIAFHTQSMLRVFLTYGENDPYIDRKSFEILLELLEKAGIEGEAFTHQQGHRLVKEELKKAKVFYE